MDPKILLQYLSRSVLLVFFCKSFIVFNLTFRSLVYFEFLVFFLICVCVCVCVCVYGVRQCSNLVLLHVAV